ncbi:hypothetical protein U1Q18_044772 [Sarracenia purpurea var. burkii]
MREASHCVLDRFCAWLAIERANAGPVPELIWTVAHNSKLEQGVNFVSLFVDHLRRTKIFVASKIVGDEVDYLAYARAIQSTTKNCQQFTPISPRCATMGLLPRLKKKKEAQMPGTPSLVSSTSLKAQEEGFPTKTAPAQVESQKKSCASGRTCKRREPFTTPTQVNGATPSEQRFQRSNLLDVGCCKQCSRSTVPAERSEEAAED